jgi:hypothetical protein
MAGFMVMILIHVTGGLGIWILPVIALCGFGNFNAWTWLSVLGGLAYIVIRLWVGEEAAWFDVAFTVGWLMMLAGGHVCCPRCYLPLTQNTFTWKPTVFKHCPACGRDRRKIWPFQHWFRPEPWDGEYHDEGGGPAPDRYDAEVIRYNAQQRWLSRMARKKR